MPLILKYFTERSAISLTNDSAQTHISQCEELAIAHRGHRNPDTGRWVSMASRGMHDASLPPKIMKRFY